MKEPLTPTELKIIEYHAKDMTTIQIARKLHMSPRTLERHRGILKKKLGVKTMTGMVGLAMKNHNFFSSHYE